MKNKYILFGAIFLSFILYLGVASASDNSCSPRINLVSQDPSPAMPDSYVKVLFEVTNLANCNNGFSVRLHQEYPFSLDTNISEIQTINTNPYASGYKNSWTIPFKIKIDKDTLEGDYPLKLDYQEGFNSNFDNFVEHDFNISVQDSRTSFDAVIQDTTGSTVSIAIANVGKYAANSVIVKVPQQDSFAVTGTDGQLVGNLQSGDYSLVGFSVVQKTGFAGARNFTRGDSSIPQNMSSNNFKFDIYYTDGLGERRVVNMALPLRIGNSTRQSTLAGRGSTPSATSAPFYSNLGFWIVLIVAIVLYYLYKKYPSEFRKILNKISETDEDRESRHHRDSSKRVPDWVKTTKDREKKK